MNGSKFRSFYLLFALALILSAASCKSKSPEQLDKLIAKLHSSDPMERNAAALEIASYSLAGKKAVGPLITLMNSDPNRGIKTSAAFALRSIGTKEAEVALDNYKE